LSILLFLHFKNIKKMVAETHFKINLGLHVTKKLPTGYHAIETIFYPVYNQRDIIEITASEKFKFSMENSDFEVEMEKNLCVKAYRLLEKAFHLAPISIKLVKRIPSGAGIGGGSGDAATILLMLNELFQLKLSVSQLMHYGAQLGSDVPFFIYNQPCLATGVGEKLSPITLDLSAYNIELVFSDVHVSTADAYSWITPKTPKHILTEVIQQPMESWKELLVNDFETVVFERFPVLEQTKMDLYKKGAIYAAMSGSGSSIFGIFPK